MRRKKLNSRFLILLCFFLLLFTISSAYAVLKQKLTLVGKANLVMKEETNQDYIVTYVIDHKWYTNGKYYYDITFTLFNNTQNLLEGWQITLDAPEDVTIVNYSNVNCKVNGKKLELSSVTYNAQVPSKQSINFELQLSTIDPYYEPSNITINGNSVIPPIDPIPPEEERNVEITLKEDNSWSSDKYYYYQYTATLKNISTTSIHSWQFDLNFSTESLIDQIWNAIASQENNNITIKNSTYNGIIQPNSEISFGFILKTTQENPKLTPINVILK